MATPAKLILGLLLYVVTMSMLIGMFSVGMDMGEIGEVGIDYTAPTDESIWNSVPFIGETFESLGFIGSAVVAVGKVLLWTLPETLFPLWANIVFIKIPLVVLIFAILDVLLP